tara:strand:+ start:1131 stop:2822 length:1692 start_codon:yes stop_codon:yes gene_type:complete
MIKHLRVLPLFLAVFAMASCASLPDNESTAYGAFLAARHAGVNRDAQGAADYYAEALRLMPGDTILTDRAFITAILAGEMERAVPLAVASTAAGDPSRLAGLYLTVDQIRGRRYPQALDTLHNAPDYGPFNAFLAQIWTQWALLGSGAAEEALTGAENLSAPGFLAPFIPIHRAMLFDAADRIEDADGAYQAAVFASPFPRMATELYGNFLERQRRSDDAVALYQAYLEGNPLDASIRLAVERASVSGRPPRRPSFAQFAARSAFGPAASLAAQADMDLAVVYLRMLQRLDPADAATRVMLGETLQRINLPELALVEYAAVPAGPFKTSAEIDRIWLMARLGNVEPATQVAQQLVQATGDTEARLILADLLRVQNRCGEAAELYRGVIVDRHAAGQPDDWRHYYFRAACLYGNEDWSIAETAYLEALEVAPNEPQILNDLGYLWIDHGVNISRAFEMVSRAAELEPEQGNIIDSLGWAHYRLGHYEAAVSELERAAALDPGNATINYHLGDAYWQVGRRLEAGFQWHRTLDLDPDETERAGLAVRLQSGVPAAESIPIEVDNP